MKSSTHLPDPIIAAEKLLAKAGILIPPVDLRRIVSIWPNLFVVEEELDGTGYLLPIGELGAEILINKKDSEVRRRFTIAHELGHWVLGISLKKKVGHFAQPKNVLHVELEKWCDRFATNILMPRFMIEASVQQEDLLLALNTISNSAARFKVSEEAFFIRLWETLRFQVAFVISKGLSRKREYLLQRSFAEERQRLVLEDLLQQRPVIEQLCNTPFPVFSVSGEEGRIQCAGRRLSNDRLILVLRWPPDIAYTS